MLRLKYFLYLLLLAGLFTACSSKTTSKSKIKTFVLDYEKILTKSQIASIDSMFRAHEKRTSNEVALLTTPDFGTDSTIEDYSLNMANTLGVGKAEKNNGVLIVFSKAQRQTRISLGYGTEKVFSDVYAQKIIDSLMLPHFKEDNYYQGLFSAGKAIVDYLEQPENKID